MSDRKLEIQEHPELGHVDNDHVSVHDAAVESQASTSSEHRMMGVAGTVFLIVNSMVGTGTFSTPSGIFAATGSVGASLVLWLVGGVLALSGLSVYLEFGLAIPRSGGEKNYLERVYRRPRFLATCVLAVKFALVGSSAANALSFGRYVLRASGRDAGDWEARGIAIACVSAAVLVHSVHPAPASGSPTSSALPRSPPWSSSSAPASLPWPAAASPLTRNFDDAFAVFDGPDAAAAAPTPTPTPCSASPTATRAGTWQTTSSASSGVHAGPWPSPRPSLSAA